MKKIILSFCILFLFSGNIFADNHSLSFDGSDDYVDVGNVGNYSSVLTVMSWIKKSSQQGWDDIIAGGGGDILFAVFQNKLVLGGQAANPFNHDTYSTTSLNDNTWHHVAATYDANGGTNNLKIYVDGVLENQATKTGSFTASNLTIGSNGSNNTENFNGNIDDVSIWSTALSQSQIQSYMSTPPTGDETSLVGYWNMNEGEGDNPNYNLIDNSGNGNNGTIYGAIWSTDVPPVDPPPPDADNHSLSFDGVDDYATFNNYTIQSMIGQNWAHEKTISAWIKPLGDSPILSASWAGAWGGQAIYGQASGSGNYFGFSRAVIGGEDRIWVYNWDGNDDRIGIEYENSEWIYITLVQDNGTLYAYKNSILIESLYTGASGNAGHQRVGGGSDNGLFFSGKIDEVSVWNTALTQTEIQSNMSTPPTGSETGLVGYWNFNEGTGTSLVDQTSDGNDGTIVGATWDEDGAPVDPPPPIDKALSFSSGQYARIEMAESLNSLNDFAIELWYYELSSASETIFGNEDANSIAGSIQIKRYGGNFDVAVSDGSITVANSFIPGVLSETWQNLSLNYDGEYIRFFIDGTLAWEEYIIFDPINSVDDDFVINRHSWNSGSSSNLSGLVDEIRISNIARHTSDFTVPTEEFIPDANTMGLWHFNDDMLDYSGNINHAIAVGSGFSDNTPGLAPAAPPLPSLTSITIDGTSGYRFLSSPVSGAIYGDLLDELWTQGMAGSDLPESSSPNVWTWNNSWNPITDLATDNYTAGSGVLVYVFANTDFEGEDDLPVTLSLDGTQNTSPVTIATNTNSWNLLGNPYGLALDVNQLLTDNSVFNSTVYLYDNEQTAYKTHNGVIGDLAEGLISPFSGFWIQAGADGNSFEFTEQSIVNSYGSAGRSTTEDETGSAVFTFHYQEHSSSVYLSFSPEGQINLDPADASRLLPMEARSHMTSMIHESGNSLSINNLPFDLSTDISMDMDVMMLSPVEGGYTTQEQDVTMEWDLSNIPEGMVFTLLDNTTDQTIDLDASETANITLPNKGILSLESSGFMGTYPELGQSQFTLTIQAATTATDVNPVPDVFALHRAYPNPFNPSTLIGYDLPRDSHVSLEIFDLNGRSVKTLINGYFRAGKHQVAWNADQISSGIYLVRLVTGKKVFNQKITYLK